MLTFIIPVPLALLGEIPYVLMATLFAVMWLTVLYGLGKYSTAP